MAIETRIAVEARRILEPGEVISHEVPLWLVRRIQAYIKAHDKPHDLDGRSRGFYLLTRMLPRICRDPANTEERLTLDWLDHWGKSTKGPYKCCHQGMNFVSEPYNFGSETARELDRACNALGGLVWHVSSNTWWNPGETVRITIHEAHSG